MTSILSEIVEGLFDYAGLFPPAALEFKEALKKSASFPEVLKRPSLVASDFVLPIAKLEELSRENLAEAGFATDRHLKLCLLGGGGDLQPKISAATKTITAFNTTRGMGDYKCSVVSLEVKIEENQLNASRLLEMISEVELPAECICFLELGSAVADDPDRLKEISHIVAEANNERDQGLLGFKVRGSGPTAIDTESLAEVIGEVAVLGVPFKATAGLHHPIIEKERYGNSHGFLNLMVALLLARTPQLRVSTEEIIRCLSVCDPGEFNFDDGVSWGSYHLTIPQALAAKDKTHFSIGSCSIEEPDQDLQRLFD